MKKTVVGGVLAGLVLAAGLVQADTQSVNFESYNLGSIDGQDGWSATGAYDHEVIATSTHPSFGSQSFRISDAVASGSFGDWVFATPLENGVGESEATAGSFSVGTRQNHFEVQFDIASILPDAEQSGLHVSVSPDRGDGSRMSFLRFDDKAEGIEVVFFDVQGGSTPVFSPTTIATLDRTLPHTVKMTMDVLDGPSNDVVKVFINGSQVHEGTSWEDYFRFNPEASAEPSPRVVKTLLIQARNPANPGNLGMGYLFDNLTLSSSNVSMTRMVPSVYATVQAALSAANPGDTIELDGDTTTTSQIIIDKAIIIDGKGNRLAADFVGAGSVNSVITIATSTVTIKDLIVDGANKAGLHGINIYVSEGVTLDGVTASNNMKSGITVNGSFVTANNITTLNNNWGGINVDLGSGVTTPAVLTVNGASSHTETGPAIWLDDVTKDVLVIDTNNQYSFVNIGDLGIYNLKTLENQTVDLGTTAGGVVTTVAEITITDGNVDVEIPAGTVVTSTDTAWDGVLAIPTVVTAPTVTPDSGTTATAVMAIEVGDGDNALTFSEPVKLTFVGQAENLVGWSRAGVFTPITANCDSPTAPTLADGADCKIIDGADLVVWTKHFTIFVTYTQTAISTPTPPRSSRAGQFSPQARAALLAATPNASPVSVVGQVLGAFTEAERQAQIVFVRGELVTRINQLIGLLQAQLAAAIQAQAQQ